ncbi:MAG: DNA replication complex GINS family protein [Candidatus Diapherotrites archaeon]|nr:DNA replication complex GINS family protein [Candidatus Diapherotrites archaeon]
MVLNYDEIRRIHRLEKNSSRLVDLEEEFFDELSELIEAEKKDYFESLKSFSINKTRSFTNMKKLVEEIFLIREKKILNRALVSAKTNEVPDDKFTSEESKFFKAVLKEIQSHDNLLNTVFSSESSKGKKKEKPLNMVAVKISSEIPSFVGTDMNEYGPFHKGQELELPQKIALLLEEKKLLKLEK